jgi:putative hemolysin
MPNTSGLSPSTNLQRSAPSGPAELARSGKLVARLAAGDEERDAVYRLRFQVFNVELQEGLDSALASGRDRDEFDDVCDHVLIEDTLTEQIVGTYRMQSGRVARRALGYYSEREFDFHPYRRLDERIVELGRACICRDYRGYEVLALLWRAVAIYAMDHHARYLIGCSSLTSQDPAVGWAMYRRLGRYEVAAELRTVPTAEFQIPPSEASADVRIPKLLRAYLAVGAKICGPPAIDREFKTIDFLTLLDLETMSSFAHSHFFRP